MKFLVIGDVVGNSGMQAIKENVPAIIKKENIDVVHCHNTFPLISPAIYYAAKRCKVPVVQTIHNFRFLCPNALFYREGNVCEEKLMKSLMKQKERLAK